MIKRVKGEYVVLSEDRTKNLGTYKTYGEALKRLREIEYFKENNKNDSRKRD